MKKFVSEWMEGKGNMRACIRTLTNWVCPTEEETKLQLLNYCSNSCHPSPVTNGRILVIASVRRALWPGQSPGR